MDPLGIMVIVIKVTVAVATVIILVPACIGLLLSSDDVHNWDDAVCCHSVIGDSA